MHSAPLQEMGVARWCLGFAQIVAWDFQTKSAHVFHDCICVRVRVCNGNVYVLW